MEASDVVRQVTLPLPIVFIVCVAVVALVGVGLRGVAEIIRAWKK